MKKRHALTNEELSNRFKNPFDLVNYAIELAKELVVDQEVEPVNPSNYAIEEILRRQNEEVNTKEL